MKRNVKHIDTPQAIKDLVLDSLLEDFPVAFYWMDTNNTLLGCNKTELEILGLSSPEEFVGKCASSFNTNFSTNLAWENSQKVLKEDKAYTYEEVHVDENGEKTYYFSVKKPLHDAGGKIIGLLGIAVDITDRKKVEELRVKNEAAQKAAEFAKLMAGAIAHELRTPFNSIDAVTNNISLRLPILIEAYELAQANNLPVGRIRSWHMDLLKKSTQNIFNETYFSNTIIDMLLMNIKGVAIDPSTFELCSATDCIKDALARYPFTDSERKLVSFKKSKDFNFRGNALLVVHILFNLIKNALYYIAKAQRGKITIWLEQKAHENILYFKDTGYGIPKEILPQVFEQFFSKTHGGTGVGLSFCKAVMNGFGGSITCDSEEKKYTEFVLSFPKPQAKSSARR